MDNDHHSGNADGASTDEGQDADNGPDPLPEDDGQERHERVLAEEGYGEF